MYKKPTNVSSFLIEFWDRLHAFEDRIFFENINKVFLGDIRLQLFVHLLSEDL